MSERRQRPRLSQFRQSTLSTTRSDAMKQKTKKVKNPSARPVRRRSTTTTAASTAASVVAFQLRQAVLDGNLCQFQRVLEEWHEYDPLLLLPMNNNTSNNNNNNTTTTTTTLVHCIARAGHVGMMECLVEYTSPPLLLQARDKAGRTVLHTAVEYQHIRLVQYLLRLDLVHNFQSQNVVVNARDGRGYTALHRACRKGPAEIVALLLQHPHVDLSVTNHRNETAVEIAYVRDDPIVWGLLFRFQQDAVDRLIYGNHDNNQNNQNNNDLVELLLQDQQFLDDPASIMSASSSPCSSSSSQEETATVVTEPQETETDSATSTTDLEEDHNNLVVTESQQPPPPPAKEEEQQQEQDASNNAAGESAETTTTTTTTPAAETTVESPSPKKWKFPILYQQKPRVRHSMIASSSSSFPHHYPSSIVYHQCQQSPHRRLEQRFVVTRKTTPSRPSQPPRFPIVAATVLQRWWRRTQTVHSALQRLQYTMTTSRRRREPIPSYRHEPSADQQPFVPSSPTHPWSTTTRTTTTSKTKSAVQPPHPLARVWTGLVFTAVKEGNLERVQELVQDGPSYHNGSLVLAELRDARGYTLLQWAQLLGHTTVWEFLSSSKPPTKDLLYLDFSENPEVKELEENLARISSAVDDEESDSTVSASEIWKRSPLLHTTSSSLVPIESAEEEEDDDNENNNNNNATTKQLQNEDIDAPITTTVTDNSLASLDALVDSAAAAAAADSSSAEETWVHEPLAQEVRKMMQQLEQEMQSLK